MLMLREMDSLICGMENLLFMKCKMRRTFEEGYARIISDVCLPNEFKFNVLMQMYKNGNDCISFSHAHVARVLGSTQLFKSFMTLWIS